MTSYIDYQQIEEGDETTPDGQPKLTHYIKVEGDIPRVEKKRVNYSSLDIDEEERKFHDHSLEEYEKLYEGNDDVKREIQKILDDYEYMKYDTIGRVPSRITVMMMSRLLDDAMTHSSRSSLLNYFYKTELSQRLYERRRTKDKILNVQNLKNKWGESLDAEPRSGFFDSNGDLMYGLWHNSPFVRIPDDAIKSGSSGSRLRQAAMFGSKLVIDFAYEKYMSNRYARNVCAQLQRVYGLNRLDYRDPFDLWFCNLKKDSISYEYLKDNAIPNLETTSMITLKEDCFTNYIDRDQCVYLTPDAKTSLTCLKPDDVYIIGAYNDKGGPKPVSMQRAAMLGVRTARIPLDNYVIWSAGSKSLCLNHISGMLAEWWSNGGNWTKAMHKHIPPRKIKSREEILQDAAAHQMKMHKKLGPEFYKEVHDRWKTNQSLRLDRDW